MAPKAKKAGAKKQAAKEVPAAAASGAKAAASIAEVFRSWDTGGDGRISTEELGAVLAKAGAVSSDEDVATIFVGADLNKDGFIDYDEFLAWLFNTAPDAVQKIAKDFKAPPKDEEEGQKRLDKLLDEVFKCFDQDQDGQLERVELLDVTEQLYKEMNDVFGVKDRKSCVQWFKDAGAEGEVSSGMYLSKEKWKVAYLDQLKKKAGCTADEPSILADYLFKNIAEKLFKICYPPSAAAPAAAAAGGEVVPETPPTYPVTIPFKDLKKAMDTAAKFERTMLILSSGKEAVTSYFTYQNMITIDCKQIIAEVYVKKNKTQAEWQEEVSNKLKSAMNSHGFCKNVHVALQNSAFDFNKFCGDAVPADVFSPSLWTPAEAEKRGFIDAGQKMNVEIEDFKKWKDFQLVLTSEFNLDSANEHLPDKIPHWDELAVIIVDPSSID